jgi:hypothetical protein
LQKHLLESAYITSRFNYHEEIKNNLLDIISRSNFKSPFFEEAEVNITKTDWEYCKDTKRMGFIYTKRFSKCIASNV